MNEENRKAQSERMKKIWAERKKDPELMKKLKEKQRQWGKMAKQKNIKQTFPPNPTLSYVLGTIEGDGFASTTQIKRRSSSQPPYEMNIVGLTVKDKEFAEAFQKAVQATINPKTRINKKKRSDKNTWGESHYFYVRSYSTPFVHWYKSLTKQQLIKHVEKSGPKGIAMFIKGFFDSDGSAYCKRRPITKTSPYSGKIIHTSMMKREIKIVKSDKQKIDALRHLLKDVAITTSLTMTDYKGERKNIYQVRINRAESQVKFCELVGSTIPRKITALTKILKWNLEHKKHWRK